MGEILTLLASLGSLEPLRGMPGLLVLLMRRDLAQDAFTPHGRPDLETWMRAFGTPSTTSSAWRGGQPRCVIRELRG
jgi:hypothetical protein